ncbi:ribonuclease E/G [Hyphomonas sp.]|uniref:ribonuclease E/G n=1 Tax=Hyphomonas sp. TaxID=87 RepID=UPI00391D94F2
MPVVRLLREQTLGETRWVALDARARPAALYLDRPHDAARRAIVGERLNARIRRLDSGLGGAFADLGAKGEAFLRIKPGETLTEGAAVSVSVVTEARRNKLPRVRLASDTPDTNSGAALWRASLNGGAAAEIEERPAGDAGIRSAFEDALAPALTLAGGGRLQVERTEALVAADIDTAGRISRGTRAAGALAINAEAAEALARQMLLRGWGGLAVLDCVAPLDKAAGNRIRTAFLEAFRDLSARQVKALAPSAFGLMEISADWQLTPLSERLQDGAGRPTAETLALEGLRQLEAAARENRMGRLMLSLPPDSFAWLQSAGLNAEPHLAQTYGARLMIQPGQTLEPEVKPAA